MAKAKALPQAEFDITIHDLTKHPNRLIEHTRKWYDTFDNKCPVCQAPSGFKLVIEGNEFKVSGRSE